MTPITYLDFDLAIDTLDPTTGRYRVRVLNAPAGQATGEFVLPFTPIELENYILKMGRTRRGRRSLGSPEGQAALALGSRLYDTLFTGAVQASLLRSLDQAQAQGSGLRLRLRLLAAPDLLELPWEFLYDTTYKRFLVHSTATPLVRYLDLPRTAPPLTVTPPLQLLVMIANPHDLGALTLDVEAEWAKVQQALAPLVEKGLIQVTRLENGSLSALQRRLRRGQYHIFHYIGHAGFDRATGQGVLLLEDEGGRSRQVASHTLGTLLHDHATLRLALLNACEGARTAASDPFAGIAQQLVQQGIPAVIAMQFEITDEAAIIFAHEFYDALADGYGVDAALAEARKAIYAAGNDVEWGTPVLYMRAQSALLFKMADPSEEIASDHAHITPLARDSLSAVVVDPRGELPLPAVETGYSTPYTQDKPKAWMAVSSSKRPRRNWWLMLGGLVGLWLIIYLGIEGFSMWQKAQDRLSVVRKAQETAIIEAPILQATATAIANSTVGATMFEQEPQLRVLAQTFGMTFVKVPAGEFGMGTDEDVASSPQHQVFVDTFWIMQTEVTNAQYRAFVAADGYNQQRWWTEAGWAWRTEKGIGAPGFWSDEQWNLSSYPIVGISWYEANAYATWLAETTDITLRLPTEAEWEKAARGRDGRLYPWGHEIDGSRANYCDENCTRDLGEEVINDDYPLAAPVGSFLTGESFYGVLDMAGNVWEWTSSLEQPYPYNREDGREVVDRSGSRVVRGGSWNSDPYFIRSVIRYKYDPAARGNTLGVRLVVGSPR